ncbi:ARM repeat-containing protein [Fistulina hepatica ATCC 64428]|uniref:ARM repeat-containing protein n=1 Tax=Fistulina hepatica ATCC 64428 TaxID=1128425 RepID=A0A0D7A3R9_9AGAR|nr:ARM repeat-containing protein [Fistulina hepatica ATCC 64428]
MDPVFAQGLHDLLTQTANTQDTNQLKVVTTSLTKNYYKNPACISALASIIASSPDQAVRQLAAVELRKRVIGNDGNLWTSLDQHQREEIKIKLPEAIIIEPSNPVRHATARAIAAIASIEVPASNWSNLLPSIQQICVSPEARVREVGSFLLYSVLEGIVESFQTFLTNLLQVLSTLMQDPESKEVRLNAVRAFGVIAQYIDVADKPELNMCQSMLPSFIQVIGQCVESGDEPAARTVFDVLETLLILEVPILSKSVPELVQFLLHCGSSRNYESDLRVLALNALNWTIQYKKSKVQAAQLGPVILEGLMPITTEAEPEDSDDDAPSRSALRIIDGLSTNLPPSQVFPALRTQIQNYFTLPDPAFRRGAMLALGVAVEGCSEYMTPLMGQVWPIIEAGFIDPDATVRKATCTAVTCLCEWLEEQCAAMHSVLVPAIMGLIQDPVAQRAACGALDAILEVMHDVIDQYLPLIMERLGTLLDTAPLSIKAVVTGAIGSAAHAAKTDFMPYFQPTMSHVQHFLVLTGEGEEIELRGITMDAIGTFAEAVGSDAFRPYFPEMMKHAFQGLQIGSARLRECSFLFFGVMARVFGEEFAPYLDQVVPALLQSCKQEEYSDDATAASLGVSDEKATAFNAGTSASNAITILDTDANGNPEIDLDDEEVDINKLLDVNSAVAVEKEIAADTIGTLFAATKSHFLPFVEPCTMELIELLAHYYEGIRKSAIDSLLEIIRTFYDLSNPAEWQAGLSAPTPLDQNVQKLIEHVMGPILQMYETEDNKSVASSLCVGLAETINKIGPAFLQRDLDTLSNMAIQILEQKAFCQQDPDQDEDEEAPEDQAEYDSVLISSAGDLVAALANALGRDFAQAFARFVSLISKYYSKNRSLSDRSAAIGCLAEIIAGMKNAITPHTGPLLALFHTALGDPEAEVKSNAAFALGLLVENSEQDLSAEYLPLLGALRPLFDVPEGGSPPQYNARDNACGAVSRLIVRNINALPLEQVLPVLLQALPLKNDFLENRPVFRAIFHLYQTNDGALEPYTDHLLRVFAYVLNPENGDQVSEDIRAQLLQLVQGLNGRFPAQVQSAGLGPYL